jgi:hypothetical protein
MAAISLYHHELARLQLRQVLAVLGLKPEQQRQVLAGFYQQVVASL